MQQYSDTHVLGDEGSPTIYCAFTLAKVGITWKWPEAPGGWMLAGSSDLARKGITIEETWIGPEETRTQMRNWLRGIMTDLKERGLIKKFRVGNTSAGVPKGPVMHLLRRTRNN